MESIEIGKKVMSNGILFIWGNKEYNDKIMNILCSKGFVYIENFTIILLSAKQIEDSLKKTKGSSFKTK